MYRTIEALYENGKIKPLYNEKLGLKRGKVLVTILEVFENSDEPAAPSFSEDDIARLSNPITLNEDPLEYQKRMRDEWE